MAPVAPLPPEALYTRCTLEHLDFKTTADLSADVAHEIEFVGQKRAIAAIELGVSIERQGYNIFALGPSGTGKYTLVSRYAEQRAAGEPPPSDWCYVNNFDQPYRPRALRLPPGMGKQLQRDMERLVEDLRTGLSSAFESEEYQNRRRVLEAEFQERQQETLKTLQDQARERNLTLLRTPAGLAFAPLREGEVIPPEEFQKLPEEEQLRIQREVEALQQALQKALLQVPRWEREFRGRLRELNEEVTALVVSDVMEGLQEKYKDLPDVLSHLQAVQDDVSEHLEDFLTSSEQKQAEGAAVNLPVPDIFKQPPVMRRYQVNVLVDSSEATGAPVIYESNPSYQNLVGRVEQMALMGALVTDFTLIKPGVLHRANGGYLILDALKVLSNPYAWEGLKRALQFREVRIESAVQMLSLTSTVSLEPEPIPLDIKVILMGDRQLYYLLSQLDPDFNELFKVAADFDDEFVRDEETTLQYARLIASIVQREKLLPFDHSAVCRVIEHGARLVSDSERVTAQIQAIVDLLAESDHWARVAQAEVVSAEHVQRAIDAQVYRADRVRERLQEEMLRRTLFIDTEGERVGQINALSVYQLGTFAFGRPSRVTATIHLGQGEVVDIEREVELSGPLHSKGVLILAGYLRHRFAQDRPLSLGARLVFEQSYGGIDGDSASSTELYALLSAIAGAPIKQSLAVTGSVNQFGEVQPIGGVNEKIEGFFDLCKARGLTGEQGVLIPAANVKHLMLRHDVIQAVAAGQFHIYPVETIDQGIELLTGIPAGEANAKGVYPEGTINRMVADRLAELAEKRKELDEKSDTKPARRRKKEVKETDGAAARRLERKRGTQ
ncbi:MAG TPA: ATP-binding protein [Caldilineaceae bacterium]|nr:ATP-binding protein [Caldilineaceae bacterium]